MIEDFTSTLMELKWAAGRQATSQINILVAFFLLINILVILPELNHVLLSRN